jgi:hypothetical protein
MTSSIQPYTVKESRPEVVYTRDYNTIRMYEAKPSRFANKQPWRQDELLQKLVETPIADYTQASAKMVMPSSYGNNAFEEQARRTANTRSMHPVVETYLQPPNPKSKLERLYEMMEQDSIQTNAHLDSNRFVNVRADLERYEPLDFIRPTSRNQPFHSKLFY